MSREQKFGRILAIANTIGGRVFPKGHPGISAKYMHKIKIKPAAAFAELHTELMNHSSKFGSDEQFLFELLGEQVAELEIEEMNNKPLNESYIINYYHKNSELDSIMGVEQAALKWGLSAGYIRNLCAEGTVEAKRIGRDWVISKNHPNPKKIEKQDE